MSFVEPSQPFEGQPEQLNGAAVPMDAGVDMPTVLPPRTDSLPAPKSDPLQVLVDAEDEQCLIREATILNTKEVKTKGVIVEPPAIPKRNTLRASHFLDSLRLNSIKSATKSLTAPHTVYLSSEEDASSSSGEFSDNDYESSTEETPQLPPRRKSKEVTARAVSVMFVGKPSIVELATARRPMSPVRRPQSELITRPASSRAGMDATRNHSAAVRKTYLAPISDLKESPSFLSQDPFSSSPYTRRQSTMPALETNLMSHLNSQEQSPSTPTSTFQRLQKTINLARKRSRPNLKVIAEKSASTSSLHLPTFNLSQESQASSRLEFSSPSSMRSHATYNDMLRASPRSSTAPSPITPLTPAHEQVSSPIAPTTTKRGLLSGLNMSRRRSMKIRA
ncbi:hypothetical protein GGR50DRAFT_261796 [Xylaria sp. CBS 124048]|nr:hypothetical protein GGR50DRAFT_261796 [Xylaria sp. CBS 124048]